MQHPERQHPEHPHRERRRRARTGRRPRVAIGLLLVVLLGALSACADDDTAGEDAFADGGPPSGTSPQPLAEVREITVGVTSPIASYANFFLADRLGAFEEENLDVTFEVVPAQDAQLLLNQGRIDVALTAINPGVLNLAASGGDVRAVWAGGGRPEGSTQGWYVDRALLDDQGDLDGDRLEGARLAGPGVPGTGALSFLFERLRASAPGLAVDDLTYENLQVPDAVTALRNGSVDLAYASSPFNAELETDDRFALVEDSITSDPTVFAWFGAELRERDSAAGVAFVRAVARVTLERLQGDYRGDDEVMDALADVLDQPREVLAGLEQSVFDPAFTLPESQVAIYQDFYREQDTLTYEDDLAAGDVFDRRFVEAIRGSGA